MKNSYKFALGLLVAVLAIGFSAFKTNEDVSKKKLVTVTYYHIGNNYVQTVPPANYSCKNDDYNCTVSVTATNPPTGFSETAIPAGATLGETSGSWKP
ncbi:hypothetical protein FMM05_20700 [Flavobacterium zepuense]|uniref:Uncharacterized protein n=1 Tax=Flavobacterium zepuense TaxID=2593302 RepID=A0A552US59_9FLAO|nr:DUF6520 family protein [Flavobacterium zepuense]TRW21063.1 hypothetical protein FMM05_20700 [Flavobacterium zepuense]